MFGGGGRVAFGQPETWLGLFKDPTCNAEGRGMPYAATTVRILHATTASDAPGPMLFSAGTYNADLTNNPLPEFASTEVPQAIAQWNGIDWAWLIGPGTSGSNKYMSKVDALETHDGNLWASGNLKELDGTDLGPCLASWDGTDWTIELALDPADYVVDLLSYDDSIYYAGCLYQDFGGTDYLYVGRLDQGPSTPVQIFFADGDEPCTAVLSIAAYTTTDETPNAYLWCSIGLPPCVEGGPEITNCAAGAGPVFRLDIDGDGFFHTEELGSLDNGAESYGGYLIHDTTTSPHTLVFGFSDNVDYDPWDHVEASCGDIDDPSHVVLRRGPTGAIWTDAASNRILGVTQAFHIGPDGNNGQTLYIAGQSFAFEPENTDCDEVYLHAGLFRINNGAWEIAPGEVASLSPDHATCSPTGWYLPAVTQGPDPDIRVAIFGIATFTDACGDSYLAVGGDFSDIVRPGDSSSSYKVSKRIAMYGRNKADFNFDNFVDFFDYDDYVACFEDANACPEGVTADFNCDGFADFFDYADFVFWFENGG